jgi:hypothetical protein
MVDKYRIEAVLEKKSHPMTADGYGFGELIFSIKNIGHVINSSEVTIEIECPGQTKKHTLSYPEGISTLRPGDIIPFNSAPVKLGRGSGAMGVLTRISDGEEIARTTILDIQS